MTDLVDIPSALDARLVRVDRGGANQRIIVKEERADFRRIEAAGLRSRARFSSAEGKRYFLRLFNTLQINAHFLSVIARTRLDHAEVVMKEAALRERIDLVTASLNTAIDGAEALFGANGITEAATYETHALDVEVSVLSSMGRRFLEALGKFDQLMPLLQTLEIHEVISTQSVDMERAAMKRQLRDVARFARSTATVMRQRMNSLANAGPGAAAEAGTRSSDAIADTTVPASAGHGGDRTTAVEVRVPTPESDPANG